MTDKLQQLDVLTSAQAALIDEIKEYHAGLNKAYDHQAQYAFMAGLKMMTLRESVPNGNKEGADGFLHLREKHFPEISKSAAYRMMDFTKLCQEKLPTVGNFKNAALQLTNGELPDKEKKAVLQAVYEAADGKSWTALYRSLGKCREKEHQKHTPPKKLTADEELQAKRDSANAVFDAAIGPLLFVTANFTDNNHDADRGKAKELLDACRAYGRLFKKKKGVK